MKKQVLYLFFALTGALVLGSCGRSNSGQLSGVGDRPSWKGINPYGMVYIPQGTFHMGQSEQDVFSTFSQRPKAVSIQGFYMDETEITNNEYREFVFWVRDSIAHELMGDYIEDDFGNERLDWEYELDYTDETLDEMFYEGDMVLDNPRELNPEILEYKYKWIDRKKGASRAFKQNRASLIKEESINIYPDTLVWIRDFAYSYNDNQTRAYFSHPAYDDYPVVGVNWKQTKAFCHWRTKLWNTHNKGQSKIEAFRLPLESEWEYASRGGHDLAPYPWGGYYVRNAKGCLLANFKPGRGDYPEDGGFYTVAVDSYFPNDYGLYQMSGNVSEWTESAYWPGSYSYMHDMNPDVKFNAEEDDPESHKRKVIRGGSWKDISYYLQTGTRDWEYQDTAKAYIGFRCVMSYLGRSPNDL